MLKIVESLYVATSKPQTSFSIPSNVVVVHAAVPPVAPLQNVVPASCRSPLQCRLSISPWLQFWQGRRCRSSYINVRFQSHWDATYADKLVSFDEHGILPVGAGVYAVYNRNNELQLVGILGEIHSFKLRRQLHLRTSSWVPSLDIELVWLRRKVLKDPSQKLMAAKAVLLQPWSIYTSHEPRTRSPTAASATASSTCK